jgi:hypothetical protein
MKETEKWTCPIEGCDREFVFDEWINRAAFASARHAHLDMHMIKDAIVDVGIGIVEALEGEEVEVGGDEDEKEDGRSRQPISTQRSPPSSSARDVGSAP